MVNNKHLFRRNLEVHNHNTRSAKNFHLPITNLTIYQKGAYYTGIKIFNYLPTHIKKVTNEIEVFKMTLIKRFLLDNSFYSTDEYFNANMRVGTLIVATIYLQLIQNRYRFQSFTVLQCSHQHCVQPVASDVEVVGYL